MARFGRLFSRLRPSDLSVRGFAGKILKRALPVVVLAAGVAVFMVLKATKPELPIMLVTNYQQHQDAAVAAGCVPGYGKNDLFSPTTVELFRGYLAE